MKVLITGGAGFIGSHLAESLLKSGHQVVVLDDLSTGSLNNINHIIDHPKFKFIYGSILDALLMRKVVGECDTVVHLAAAVGVKLIVDKPVETMITNLRGTEILLDLVAKNKLKTLIASTSEVYGKSSAPAFNEDDDLVMGRTTKSRWSYACSKAIDEFLALAYNTQYGLPTVVMRFFNTVGPRQTGRYGMVLPTFVRQALSGEPITVYGDGMQTRTFTYVKDIVRGIIGLMDHDGAIGKVFNLGGKEEISILEFAWRVKEVTGSHSPIVKISYEEAYSEGFEDMRHRVPDISKIERLIGFDPATEVNTMIQSVAEYEMKRIRQMKSYEIRPTVLHPLFA